jgi:hypothetical protein
MNHLGCQGGRKLVTEQACLFVGDEHAGVKNLGNTVFITAQSTVLAQVNPAGEAALLVCVLRPFVGIHIHEIDHPFQVGETLPFQVLRHR